MVEIKAFVRVNMVDKVIHALEAAGIRNLTVIDVRAIWQGLKQGCTLAEISRRLQEEFDVEANQAEHSVLALVDDLSRQGLVQSLD